MVCSVHQAQMGKESGGAVERDWRGCLSSAGRQRASVVRPEKVVNVPLFNSYIFVQIEEQERNRVFEFPGAVRYLFWLGKPAMVKDSEIETIQNWLSAPATYEVSLDEWKKGDKIVLESGPFVSQSAIIQEVKQNHYIMILESLGCVLRVDKKEN